MKRYPARLSISGEYRLWRSINRDTSRLLSKFNDNKVMKKRLVMFRLQLKSRKRWYREHRHYRGKLPFIEKVPSESDDSRRSNEGLFDTSEDNSNGKS